MSRHTPTPWFLRPLRSWSSLGEAPRYEAAIATTAGPPSARIVLLDFGYGKTTDSANAEFIVRAANSHEELLSLLKEALASLDDCDQDLERNAHDIPCGNCDAAVPMGHSLGCRIKNAIHRAEKQS